MFISPTDIVLNQSNHSTELAQRYLIIQKYFAHRIIFSSTCLTITIRIRAILIILGFSDSVGDIVLSTVTLHDQSQPTPSVYL